MGREGEWFKWKALQLLCVIFMTFMHQTFWRGKVKGGRLHWKSVAFPLSCTTEIVCSSGPN